MSKNTVLVSILCITYNQKDYIKQCIDGFLMQKTDFNFEILINDDASSDGTVEILKEYQSKYPDKIILNLQQENQYSKGVRHMIARFLLPKAKGKYLALCEGDDYWTDDNKLQIQVDFMEKNPDHSLCFHPVRVFFENNEEPDSIFPPTDRQSVFSAGSLIRGNYIQTNSVLYRKQNYDNMVLDATPGDWYLHLYHAQFGKIGFINKVMSDYRRHSNGTWWSKRKNTDYTWKKNGLGYVALFNECLKMYGDNNRLRPVIESQIIDMFNRLMTLDSKYGTDYIKMAISKYPDSANVFLQKQNESIQHINTVLNEKDSAVHRLSTDLYLFAEEAATVKQSKSFILGYSLLHPHKIPRQIASYIHRFIKSVKYKIDNRTDIQYADQQYLIVKEKLQKHTNSDSKKLAIILHLYYIDMWPYFRDKLKRLDDSVFTLFVSVPIGKESIEKEIMLDYPSATVVFTPNRGRDVLPFVQIIKTIKTKGYVYILKMHSKKSKHRKDGNAWMDSIIKNLIPDNKRLLNKVLKTLQDKQTGVIGPDGQYIALPVNYEANKHNLRQLITNIKSSKVCRHVDRNRFDYGFFAGTMFWARIDALKELLDKNMGVDSFDLEMGQIDNTFAHALERAFCVIPELNGKKMYASSGSKLNHISYYTDNIPSWSDVHVGKETKN